MVAGVEELSERVMALVADETGRARVVITPDTDIERDLGCSVEEIRALLARLEREFRIDMSGLDFDRHFDRAGSLLWPFAVALVVALPATILLMFLLQPIYRAAGLAGSRIAANGGLFALTYLACVLLLAFTTAVLPRLRARRVEKLPVTVQTLIEAALIRRWPFGAAEDNSK